MTTRRFPVPMLYGPPTPARWLRTLAATIDRAAAGLCWQQWRHGFVPRLQPARVASVTRTRSGVK